ncbi:MAG: sulfatase-like hydrolase/transferase [Planctomycetota bacterium]
MGRTNRRGERRRRSRRGRENAALPPLFCLLLPLLLLLPPLFAACAPRARRPARSALLVTLDTTRVEAIGCYGPYRGATPALDRFARSCVRFAAAYAVVPLTLPSHASMLTGLYPPAHGVRANGPWPLSPAAETLAELALRRGHQTAAVVGSVVLDETFGLAQGFAHYDAPARPAHATSSHAAERPADAVVDRALAWLAGRDRDRPFFLWVHLFDPHAPYLPPPAFRTGPFAENPYFGEVAFADRELGRLLAALEDDGTLAETTVLVVADHGEAFGEHGESTHGLLCYEPTMHVPMLLRLPDESRAGEVVTETVSVADAFPTLAAALGIPVPEGGEARDLHLPVPPGRGVYVESYTGCISHGWAPLAGWIDAGGKYLHGPEPEFYSLASDPREERNLAGTAAADVTHHLAALGRIAALPPLPPAPAAESDPRRDALLAGIRALGYAATPDVPRELPSPLAIGPGPAPARRVEVHGRLLVAQELVNAGRWPEAERILREVLAAEPGNSFALDRLGIALIEQGRAVEAIAPLARLVAEGAGDEHAEVNLALSLAAAGRTAEAIAHVQRALALRPNEPYFLDVLIDLFQRTGRSAEAERARALREERRRAGER